MAVFLLERGGALLAELDEVRLASRANEVGRRPETIPQTLRVLTRRLGDFLPLGVKLAKGARRGRQIRRS